MNKSLRMDHKLISDMVRRGSTVLDLGCGNGDLLEILQKKRGTNGQGVEVNEEAIYICVEKKLSVFHMDINSGLSGFANNAFQYVILNRVLSETTNISFVLNEALRVGEIVIVGFPNFAHFRSRMHFFFKGRSQFIEPCPYIWHESSYLHFFTINDIEVYLKKNKIRVLRRDFFSNRRISFRPDLFAKWAIYLISTEKVQL
ncbi:MAG: methyltransferase domain-containing protein [Candidatus Aminicenantes bacterium]|nr:methyltransferase domain-containing protein [Candidatus Aminicenantes bacterium]